MTFVSPYGKPVVLSRTGNPDYGAKSPSPWAAIDRETIREGGIHGNVLYSIDGEAATIGKAAMATGVTRMEGMFDQD